MARRLQFSLRSLFVGVCLWAILAALVGEWNRRNIQRGRASNVLTRLGADVYLYRDSASVYFCWGPTKERADWKRCSPGDPLTSPLTDTDIDRLIKAVQDLSADYVVLDTSRMNELQEDKVRESLSECRVVTVAPHP